MATYLTPTYLAPRTKTPGQIAAERERLTGARELTAQTQAILAAEGRARMTQVRTKLAVDTAKAAEAVKAELSPDAVAYAEKKGLVKALSNPQIDPKIRAREIDAFEKDFRREKVFHPAMKALGWSKLIETSPEVTAAGGPAADVWVQRDPSGEILDYSLGQPAFATKQFKQQLYAESIAKARSEQAVSAAAKNQYSIPSSVEVGVGSYETLGYIGDDAMANDPAVPAAQQYVVTAKPAGCGWVKHLLPALGAGIALWLILRKKKRSRR